MVEDSQIDRFILSRLLNKVVEGAVIAEAENGQDALDIIQSSAEARRGHTLSVIF